MRCEPQYWYHLQKDDDVCWLTKHWHFKIIYVILIVLWWCSHLPDIFAMLFAQACAQAEWGYLLLAVVHGQPPVCTSLYRSVDKCVLVKCARDTPHMLAFRCARMTVLWSPKPGLGWWTMFMMLGTDWSMAEQDGYLQTAVEYVPHISILPLSKDSKCPWQETE